MLIAQLRFGNRYSDKIPRALGELADAAAIEPLRMARLAGNLPGNRRAAIYGALVRLNADGVLNELRKLLEKPNPATLNTAQALTAIAQSDSEASTSMIAPYLVAARKPKQLVFFGTITKKTP